MVTLQHGAYGLTDLKPVAIVPGPREGDVPQHGHDFCEIALLVEGRLTHRSVGGTRFCDPGTVIVVQPGETHSYRPIGPVDVRNLMFLPEWLMADLPRLWDEPALVALFLSLPLFGRNLAAGQSEIQLDDATWDSVLQELHEIGIILGGEGSSTLLLRYSLLKLLCHLSAAFVRQSPELHEANAFRKEVWYVLRSIEHGLAHGEPFSLNKAAETLGVSRRHLTRMFKEVTGESVRVYFHHRRVHFAKHLLLDHNSSVTEVALAAGFCDAAHFCRDFKRDVGCRPGEYRVRALDNLASGAIRQV